MLVAFKAMKDATGDCGWNTVGQSRGATTITNALAVLNQPVDTWHDTFKESCITEDERLVLLESIKKGVVVIETPAITTASGIHGNGTLFIKRYVNVPDTITSLLCDFANNVVLPIVSRGNYAPDGEQALFSVDELPEGLKVLLHFQDNDKDVSNKYDQLFSEKMIKRLGRNNVWIVLGNDGGKELDDATWKALEEAKKQGVIKRLVNRKVRAHNSGSHTLLKKGVINALYKQHGGAYVNDEDYLARGERILQSSHMMCHDDLEKYFKNYDVNSAI